MISRKFLDELYANRAELLTNRATASITARDAASHYESCEARVKAAPKAQKAEYRPQSAKALDAYFKAKATLATHEERLRHLDCLIDKYIETHQPGE